MAVWPVPDIEPRFEFLLHALSFEVKRGADVKRKLYANWLRLPWLLTREDPFDQEEIDAQWSLRISAIGEMNWSDYVSKSPIELAEKIASARAQTVRAVLAWLVRTRQILAALDTIYCKDWLRNGSGLANQ